MKTPIAKSDASAAAGSVVGADLVFEGAFSGKGELTILGQVRGSVSVERVTVRELAQMVGSITGGEVDVRGDVEGDIHGQTLRIFKGGRIKGGLECTSLYVETGSSIEGEVRCAPPPSTLT